jgi:organic hydroperoxide reductase OsmC/OhrA
MNAPHSEEHHFICRLVWSGAAKGPTTTYEGYSREYRIDIPGKPSLRGSAAPAFRGDPSLMDPEDLLVAALSACHFLSYVALCARAGVHVIAYEDDAEGKMERVDGAVRFTDVTLHPKVTIAPGSDAEKARALHERAHAVCFIANSVNFPVLHSPTITAAAPV